MEKVEIIWVDSLTEPLQYWCNKDNVIHTYDDGVPTMRSIGYIVKEENDYIIIVQSEAETLYGGILMIPKAAIKEIKR